MNRFTAIDLPLSGLKRVERQNLGDARGFLSRLFCADELAAAGWRKPVAQINQTVTTRRGAVRGMHFQRPPHAEMKLVTCLRGAIFDVAVDLRKGSPTFLRWHAEELSSENRRALLIPEDLPTASRRCLTIAKCSTCIPHPIRPQPKAG